MKALMLASILSTVCVIAPSHAEDANARTERLYQANKLAVEPYEKALIAQLTKREAKIFTENCSMDIYSEVNIYSGSSIAVGCSDDDTADRLVAKFNRLLKAALAPTGDSCARIVCTASECIATGVPKWAVEQENRIADAPVSASDPSWQHATCNAKTHSVTWHKAAP
jgi:molybdopterin/thiamine biosynthesis adenylyltransferase